MSQERCSSTKVGYVMKQADLIWSHILIGHMYLSGVWLGVDLEMPKVDSSHHVRTSMIVERGIICGISIHIICQGEVLFSSCVYI